MDSGYSFEDADFLLKRDWFLSPEDIDDLLWSLYEEVYQEVYKVRHTYSRRIQDVFYHYEPRPRSRVRELTYEMMEEMWIKEDEDRARKLAESLKNFVSTPPPRSALDDTCAMIQTLLANKHEKLKNYNQRPRFYVSQIEQIAREIANLENEFKNLTDKISARNKTEHELQWIERSVRFAGGSATY